MRQLAILRILVKTIWGPDITHLIGWETLVAGTDNDIAVGGPGIADLVCARSKWCEAKAGGSIVQHMVFL